MEVTRARNTFTCCVLALALLAAPAAALADPPERSPARLVLKHTPPGVGVDLSPSLAGKLELAPGLYRLYTLDEWRSLVIADMELSALESLLLVETETNEKLEEVAELRRKEIATLKADLATEKAISVRLTEKWAKTDKALQKAKAGSVWPWVVMGISGALAITGGTALVIALTNK